jgi:hypothetical protein
MTPHLKLSDDVEMVSFQGHLLAYVIRASFAPDETTFVTQPDFKQQVGYIVYAAGTEVARHVHVPLKRSIVGTSEVVIVRKGRCEVDIYTDEKELVTTRELRTGDVMLMVSGGHGFRMMEDTILLEVKQGPYTGLEEKERF